MTPLPLARASSRGPGQANAERLLNCYAEPQPEGAAHPFVIRPTPGLFSIFNPTGGPIRAMNGDLPGRIYVVAETGFYRITNGATVALVAEVTGPLSAVATIAVGPTVGVLVLSTGEGWSFTHDGPLVPFGADFIGATSVAYLDGFFVFTGRDDDSRFFSSRLLDPGNQDALDFAYSDATPNVIRRVITHNRQLWMLGEAAIEVWANQGAADFPFRPVPGGVLRPGCINPRAVVEQDGSVFWMGADGTVYRSSGFSAKRVSTFAVERLIAPYKSLNNATMAAFAHDGHAMVALTVSGTYPAGVTVVYDCASGEWHERSSFANGFGPYRVGYAVPLAGGHLLGDTYEGRLYRFDDSERDNGMPIPRELTMPTVSARGARAFMSRLEFEMEVGTDEAPGLVTLDWSDDVGATFGPSRVASTGQLGATRTRVAFTRLGSFRERALRLRWTGRGTIHGCNALIEGGEH